MCFSPEASFASAAALIPVGGYCLWTSRRVPRLWPLAAVPIFFGLQQACEGLVWIGLRRGDASVVHTASIAYLFFALAFWPMWLPFSATALEPNDARRRWLERWAMLSTCWALQLYWPVFSEPDGAAARVVCHCIRYEYPESDRFFGGRWAIRTIYVLACSLPFLIGSLRRIAFVPVLLGVVAAFVAILRYEHAFTSVWCLFSAVLSASIAWVLTKLTRRGDTKNF